MVDGSSFYPSATNGGSTHDIVVADIELFQVDQFADGRRQCIELVVASLSAEKSRQYSRRLSMVRLDISNKAVGSLT